VDPNPFKGMQDWLHVQDAGIESKLDEPLPEDGEGAASDNAANAAGNTPIENAPKEGGASSPSKEGEFTNAQKEDIKKALVAQRKMLENKQAALKRWNTQDQADFKKAFGTTDAIAKKEIEGRVDRMLALNKGMTPDNFRVPDLKTVERIGVEPSKLFAYVNPNDTEHTIFVGTKFFSAPMTGSDSKAGTLVHEMSHFTDIGGTVDMIDGKTIYGVSASHALASTNSAGALKHADSFEYYLENTP